jgi:hypothetical protein
MRQQGDTEKLLIVAKIFPTGVGSSLRWVGGGGVRLWVVESWRNRGEPIQVVPIRAGREAVLVVELLLSVEAGCILD